MSNYTICSIIIFTKESKRQWNLYYFNLPYVFWKKNKLKQNTFFLLCYVAQEACSRCLLLRFSTAAEGGVASITQPSVADSENSDQPIIEHPLQYSLDTIFFGYRLYVNHSIFFHCCSFLLGLIAMACSGVFG
ncbi:hypothetical protein PRUPE_1G252300 [Prunus persica]|uniref:Uncharacterized protein n=1 Tax=Prunus persica TaxID=3760 RepID=A0A251R359_PRUPE|nr:hypothetical protein PRUPE_1G252300 [Prunus persica]